MKKWLAVAVLTIVALTGAVALGSVVTSNAHVQSANGGAPPPMPPDFA
jgi:hypothetical protein